MWEQATVRSHERLPRRRRGGPVAFACADDAVKVRAWISIHREDLFANWELLTTEGKFFKIEPLR